MNSDSDNSKRSLAKSLGALFAVTSGLVLTSNAQAAATNPNQADPQTRLEVRVQKVQEQFEPGATPEVNENGPASGDLRPMWWGNWHNWHPGWGWRNGGWGNGGWPNWHNWHNWRNWGNW